MLHITHLLPWWWIPPCHHAVHWASPSVAGFFQFQVWLLNVAASPLWKCYEFPLQGLLTALQFSLPHTQTTGCRTLEAQKGIRMQGSTVKSAELCVHIMSTTQYSSQVPLVTDEEIKDQSIEVNFSWLQRENSVHLGWGAVWMHEIQVFHLLTFSMPHALCCNNLKYFWFLIILHPSYWRTRAGVVLEWPGLLETSLRSGEFKPRNENDWGKTFEWIIACCRFYLSLSWLDLF